jgi:hypothetical protein
LYHAGEPLCIHVLLHHSFEIVKNSLSAISTKLFDIFVHSQIASTVIIQSFSKDFDFICHSQLKSSLPIQKTSFIYVEADQVHHIVVVQSDAI